MIDNSPLRAMRKLRVAIRNYRDGDSLVDAVEVITADLDREELVALVGYLASHSAGQLAYTLQLPRKLLTPSEN